VVLDGDGAAGPRRVPDRDILVEGRRAQYRRVVDTLILPDGVGPSIARDSTLLRTRLSDAHLVIDDVVLDKGVGGPAIDGEAAEPAGDTK